MGDNEFDMKCEIIAKKIKSSALSHGPNSVYGRVL
jgi:hypothetical protein